MRFGSARCGSAASGWPKRIQAACSPPILRQAHNVGVGGDVPDARAAALADYLRRRAAAFSLSADESDQQHIARAGMALLDAAVIAEGLSATDERLTALSEAGLFETMPDGKARFLETAELRAAVQRPLAGTAMSGHEVLRLLVDITRGA
jgi:hypothetical protein